MINERLILLHCSLIDGFGSASLTKVINYLKNCGSDTLESIYSLSIRDFERAGLSHELSSKLVKELANKEKLEKELILMDKFGIKFVTILDDAELYPTILKNIYLPPLVLYVQGACLSSFPKTVAIVGSRKCDNYGAKAIDLLVPDLLRYGWCAVSGGAYGIDTLVHQKTLQENGSTIAVLGSGLLNPYPAANKKLFKEISSNKGAVISSFPLNAPPLAGNFPARNRIIAGLSKACLVVQAAQKSGALITAKFALEQGKDVGVVPGAIDNPLSIGCNELLRQGAACIGNSLHLLELLQEELSSQDLIENKIISDKKDEMPINKDLLEEKKSVEAKILLLCRNASSFDELLQELNISFVDLNDKLLELQLSGYIVQTIFGLWETVS